MKRSEILLMVLQVPLDFFLLLLAGVSAYYLRFTSWAVDWRPVVFKLGLPDFLGLVVWVSIGWLIIFALLGLYSTNPNRKLARDLIRAVLACSAGLAAVAVYAMFALEQFDSRFLVAAAWIFAVAYVCLGRILMRGLKGLLYRAGLGLRRVVVIGDGDLTQQVIGALNQRRELGYNVVAGFANFGAAIRERLPKLKPDELLFINPRADAQETLAAIDFCNQRHIIFKYSADLFATYSANMAVSTLAGVPIVELKRTSLDGWGRVAKLFFDILLSLVVIIITSPLLLFTALIILWETGRPVIYRNERVGLRGQKFFAYKFRSMYQRDSTGPQFGEGGKKAEIREKELIKERGIRQGPIYKIQNDPRVTPFGRFIRRWSLDELPQFSNVLKGEMSIVGPRPHQPREVRNYEENYRQVFALKPGITGLAQISGRSDLSFEEEIKLDVFYIEKWSLFLDLIIFLKTPFVIFKKRRAL